MSGKADSLKRRKRRKTRGERNMSRNVVTGKTQQQDTKHKSSKKDEVAITTASKSGLTCTRGPSKGASLFVPTNYKTATSGTITQSRITTSHHMFTNSKSSDCIKRVRVPVQVEDKQKAWPIPETEAVKKKVENDLKRILNFAESNKNTNNVEPVNPSDAIGESQYNDNNSGAEISAMEVDAPVQSSKMVNNLPHVDMSSQSPHNLMEKSSTKTRGVYTVDSSVGSKPKSKKPAIGRTSSGCESIFSTPGKEEEYLEPEVPVEAAAGKFLKELKTKITLMFPNRDIQKEISCDLQKLVKQSPSNASSKSLDSAIPFTDNAPRNTSLSMHGKSVVNSTLSVFRPPVKFLPNVKVGRSSPRDMHPYVMDRTPHCHHLPHLKTERAKDKSEIASFCPDSIVERDSGTAEPIIRLITTTSDSSSDSFEVDDGVGGLTTACCDAFIADAKDLQKHNHQRQKYLLQNLKNTTHHCRPNSLHHDFHRKNLSSASNNDAYYSWMDASPSLSDNLPSLSCPLPSNQRQNATVLNETNVFKNDPRCHLSNSAINRSGGEIHSYCSSAVSRPNLMHQRSQERHKPFLANCTTNGLLLLRKEHSHSSSLACSNPPAHSSLPPHHGQPRSRSGQNERFFPSLERDPCSFPKFGSFPDIAHNTSNNGECSICECKCVGSVAQHNTSDGGICQRLASHQLVPHIIQSRQNLQIALDSACRDSGVDVSFKASSDDHIRKDDFSIMFEQAQPPSQPGASNLCSSWLKHGTVHTNQADMQRQARDFLDEMDDKSEPTFQSRKHFPKTYFGKTSSSPPEVVAHGNTSSRSNDLPLKAAYM